MHVSVTDYDYLRPSDDDEMTKHNDIYNDISFDYGSRKCSQQPLLLSRGFMLK